MRASVSTSRSILAALGATLSLVLSAPVIADGSGHLEVTTIVEKEVVIERDDGETTTQLVEAQSVVPGEKVVYTITFKNVGDAAAENVVITNPISESLTYVAGSASNGEMSIEFSADGGKTFGPAGELRVLDGDIDRPATTQDYTHIRWIMRSHLDVGAEGSASFAAVLQ